MASSRTKGQVLGRTGSTRGDGSKFSAKGKELAVGQRCAEADIAAVRDGLEGELGQAALSEKTPAGCRRYQRRARRAVPLHLGAAVFAADDVVAFDDSGHAKAGAAVFHAALDANDF